MLPVMACAALYGKVLRPVVAFYAVDVVHDFIGHQRTSNNCLHDDSVLAAARVFSKNLRLKNDVAIPVYRSAINVKRMVRPDSVSIAHVSMYHAIALLGKPVR